MYFQIPLCQLLMLAENLFPLTVNQTWLLFWRLWYLIITIIEGQTLMYTVCRKTKANAFCDFAYNFTEATSEILNQEKILALMHTRTIP